MNRMIDRTYSRQRELSWQQSTKPMAEVRGALLYGLILLVLALCLF